MPSAKHDPAIVELWEVLSPANDRERAANRRLLVADERARADRYRFERDRDLFVSCRAALRRVLGTVLDLPPSEVPLTTDTWGKPRVDDADVLFNVTHAGGRGLIVVGAQPVGVDLEPLRSIADAAAIARRFFTTAEQTAIFRDDDLDQISRRFLQCWTLKEAVLKARGVGLSGSLTDFSVDIEADPPQVSWSDPAARRSQGNWSLGFVPVWDRYIGAVAVESPSWALRPRGRG